MISYGVFLFVVTAQLLSSTLVLLFLVNQAAKERHELYQRAPAGSPPVVLPAQDQKPSPRVRSPMRPMFEPEQQQREER